MTPYANIFDKFLIKIEDYNLLNNYNESEIIQILSKYLNGAIVRFSVICRKDLFNKDDQAQMFNVCLDDMEEEILALFMVLEWINPYINNRLNVKQFLGDRDFKVFSQANFLKELQTLQENVKTQAEEMEKLYSWRTINKTLLS